MTTQDAAAEGQRCIDDCLITQMLHLMHANAQKSTMLPISSKCGFVQSVTICGEECVKLTTTAHSDFEVLCQPQTQYRCSSETTYCIFTSRYVCIRNTNTCNPNVCNYKFNIGVATKYYTWNFVWVLPWQVAPNRFRFVPRGRFCQSQV